MGSSYAEVGVEGSPFRLPLWLRKGLARLVSYHPFLWALSVWSLHHIWGSLGLKHSNPLIRDWCQLACRLSMQHCLRIARAVAGLDRHDTFRRGKERQGVRNCLESVYLRSGFLDLFFHSYPIPRTEWEDPHQRPYYLVPGIPARRYYPNDSLEWAHPLEKAYPIIREELLGLLRDSSGFGAYQTEFNTTVSGWNTFPLWLYGNPHEANARRCPRTTELLRSLPGFESGEWILFSALNAHSRIPPHVGPINGILRAHLAMVVPENCGLRVGGQEAQWQQGQVLVFDDSFVHEVWNHSDQVRIVLFLNFWHPCLSLAERQALAQLRQAYHETPVGEEWLARQERPLATTLQA